MFHHIINLLTRADHKWDLFLRNSLYRFELGIEQLPAECRDCFSDLAHDSNQFINFSLSPRRFKKSPFVTRWARLKEADVETAFAVTLDAFAGLYLSANLADAFLLNEGFKLLGLQRNDILFASQTDEQFSAITAARMLFPSIRDILKEPVEGLNQFDIVGAIPVQMMLQAILEIRCEQKC